jgi:hypothetical protein
LEKKISATLNQHPYLYLEYDNEEISKEWALKLVAYKYKEKLLDILKYDTKSRDEGGDLVFNGVGGTLKTK